MRNNALLPLTLCCGLLAACSQSSGSGSTATAVKPLVADKPATTGVPEIKRINKSGGTKYAVLVNNEPITTNDIRRRAAFVKLRRMKGNRTEIARNELIDEKIKMQEARRINAVVGDKQVNDAYLNFAKRNKIPLPAFNNILAKSGVTKRGFKSFIRAQMSWQRAVSARVRAEARGTTKPKTSPAYLPEIGREMRDVEEYTIQQVVFVVPQNKRGQLMSKRRLEARQFRNRYTGCEGAKGIATGLKDVSVIERGRVRALQLPPRWSSLIKTTPVGKITKPVDTEKGVEMLAVCRKREVKEALPADGDLFSEKNFGKAVSRVDAKYLAELKKRAVIKRR